MEKKLFVVFEIIVIIGVSLFYVFREVIPEYKKNMGSSDNFIRVSEYKNMIEFDIDNKVNFTLVINEEKKIYHIMFFDNNSICLYNKNIENKSISDVISKVVQELIENNFITSNSITKITRYDDYCYSEFINNLNFEFSKYNLNTNFIEKVSNLKEKAEMLGLNTSLDANDENILRLIDNYSKEIVRNSKNKTHDNGTLILNEESSKKYSNNVYKKIEDYIKKNNISNLDMNSTELIISMIPADENLKYYPSSNSWYYVKNGRIFSYIQIIDGDKSYSYCYRGSIDLVKKGECYNEEND